MTSIFDSNQEYPAQICDELLCGQDQVYRFTDTWTDAYNNITLWPEKPRGKNGINSFRPTQNTCNFYKHI